MKKLLMIVLCIAVGVCGMVGCGGEKDIAVIARTSSSGTRDAFESLIKDESRKKLADSEMISTAEELDATSGVMTKVANTESGIGYISLGSLDESVKPLKINGVEATVANVINGSYKLWRPFVIMTKKGVAIKDATADFLNYIKSADAQDIVNSSYIPSTSQSYTAPDNDFENATIIIRGSTSVEPLMNKLIAAYKELNEHTAKVVFDIDCQGSSAGKTAAKEDVNGNVIGMSSSELKDGEKESYDYFNVAKDAVVLIVNKKNDIENLTISQIYAIYTGSVKKFSELSK